VNDMRQMTNLGRKIENSSFEVIDQEIGPHDFTPQQWEVVRRVIHATADFEYKHLMMIHDQAIRSGIEALKNGCPIVCDVQMIIAGLNKARLDAYGCKTHSFISDEDVIKVAKANNSTRAIESFKKAAKLGLLDGAVLAVGNAPTALLEIIRLIKEENIKPALIIGVPVGFVSAVESKEEVLDMVRVDGQDIPYILSRGRKGGSTIAVSIIHALLLLSTKEFH
jgi:precorrin-8X/cobalt-precorrin-8 methylmutase